MAALVAIGLFLLAVLSVDRYQLLSYPPVSDIQWYELMMVTVTTILINTLLSVIYPHIMMKRLEIVSALKGPGSILNSKAFGHAGDVIRTLLVFQILTSAVFMSSALLIYRQLQLLDEQPFIQEVHIKGVFPGISGASGKYAQTVDSAYLLLSKRGMLIDHSFSNLESGRIKTRQEIQLNDSSSVFLTVVDPAYLVGRDRLLRGNWFHPRFGYSPGLAILDATAAQPQAGYDSISGTWQLEKTKYRTIGIISSASDTVKQGYVSGFRYLTFVDLTLNYRGGFGTSLDEFLQDVESDIAQVMPYFFLLKDGQVASGESAADILALFVFFGCISLLVAVIGLFGLSHFVTQKKSLEVGIRKVLGASNLQILYHLLVDFIRIILIGGLLSIPPVYLGGRYWLDYYAKRVDLDWTLFTLPIAIITAVS